MDAVTPFDMERLKELDVAAVIDLRAEKKQNESVLQLFRNEKIDYLQIPFGGRKPLKEECVYETETVSRSYMNIVRQHSVIKTILETVAQNEHTVLYLCKYGKDRSGVVSVLIERLAGLSAEEIVQDYVVSNQFLIANSYTFRNSGVIPLEKEWILEFMRQFDAEYGTIQHYLETIGIDAALVRRLEEKVRISVS